MDYIPVNVYVGLHDVPVTVPKRYVEGARNKKLDKGARDYFKRQLADAVHKALLADPDLIQTVADA